MVTRALSVLFDLCIRNRLLLSPIGVTNLFTCLVLHAAATHVYSKKNDYHRQHREISPMATISNQALSFIVNVLCPIRRLSTLLLS